MADYPTTYPPRTSSLNNFARHPTTENVVYNEPPPSYESLNPSPCYHINNIDPNAGQYPFQAQAGVMRNVGSASNMHHGPTTTNSELNKINNYLVWSILNIICCFCFLGFIACYYSFQTD